MVGDEPELGEQRAGVGDIHPGVVLERPQQRVGAVELVAGLLDLAHDDPSTQRRRAGRELGAAEDHVEQR